MSEEEIVDLLRIAAGAALEFAKSYPEVAVAFPASHELLPYWIARLVFESGR